MSLDIYLGKAVDFGSGEDEFMQVWTANYTHNCNKMAQEAGIYKYVWRPDECDDISVAGDLIPHLEKGIGLMESDPDRFIALNPENKWGSYETFLPWLKEYKRACQEYPKAEIKASR